MQQSYKNEKQASALDIYLTKSFKFVVIAPTAIAMYSAVSYTISYLVGLYGSISLPGLIAFDISNVIYMSIALFFLFTGIDKEGFVDRKKFQIHKIAVSIGILIQWNFTAYLIPNDDFWAWSPFFALFAVFFFDTKIMKFVMVGLSASTILAYVLKPTLFVSPNSQYFYSDVIFRLVHLILSMVFIYAIVYLGEKYLIVELEKYANYDPLTKLLNRRSMDSYIEDAYKKAKKNNEPLSLMIMDIDDFKRVNDTYGHDCGDEILKFVAREVSTGVNSDDRVFRWGGEEIFVILKSDNVHAVQIAERIRAGIERGVVKYKDNISVSVTVTVGVTSYTDGVSIQELFDEVDNRLYYGKNHGKNRVVNKVN